MLAVSFAGGSAVSDVINFRLETVIVTSLNACGCGCVGFCPEFA